jgi:hypothetical protein
MLIRLGYRINECPNQKQDEWTENKKHQYGNPTVWQNKCQYNWNADQ